MKNKENKKTETTGNNGRNEDGTFGPGNPGRPVGSISLLSMIKAQLREIPKGKKKSWAEMMVQRMLIDAVNGNEQTQKLLMNYIEGLPKQPIDLGGNANFNITWKKQ